LLLIATTDIASAVCEFAENQGRVKRINPTFASGSNPPGTYFQLIPGQTAALTNADSYYFISALPADTADTQSLYRSMHDLIVEAAKAGWIVQVRTDNCDNPLRSAPVVYLVVDF
jgi:hypothetical protein